MSTRIVPAILTAVLLSMPAAEASAQGLGYGFPNDSQGWQYMGLYEGGDLTKAADFVTVKNPWNVIDGDGAIALGQEGFTPQNGGGWLHGDLNSPDLTYKTGRSFQLSYDVTGAHMASDAAVFVQAVIVVRLPNEISDRRYRCDFESVPLGEHAAWDTHSCAFALTAGTILKKVNLRIFVETSAYYKGWILVDNVILR